MQNTFIRSTILPGKYIPKPTRRKASKAQSQQQLYKLNLWCAEFNTTTVLLNLYEVHSSDINPVRFLSKFRLAATQISISTICNIGRAKRRRLEKFHLCSFFAGVNHERRLVFIWRFTLSVLLHSSVGNLFLRNTPAIFTSSRNCQTNAT